MVTRTDHEYGLTGSRITTFLFIFSFLLTEAVSRKLVPSAIRLGANPA